MTVVTIPKIALKINVQPEGRLAIRFVTALVVLFNCDEYARTVPNIGDKF